MKRKFYTLDVFTQKAFSGNPLAVLLDAQGLDENAMQTIAKEFNLSETVFVFPPKAPENRASIRIYTPAHELPFAGHPTIGTAILLNQLGGGQEETFILEEQVGPVECSIRPTPQGHAARFGLPRASERMHWGLDELLLADALGLEASALGFGDHTVGVWSGGVPYTLVPVKTIEDVQSVEIDNAKLKQIEPIIDGIAANMYVYCAGGMETNCDFHARMFAPLFGIPEDPATGSAVASLSGALAMLEMGDDEVRTFHIEQG